MGIDTSHPFHSRISATIASINAMKGMLPAMAQAIPRASAWDAGARMGRAMNGIEARRHRRFIQGHVIIHRRQPHSPAYPGMVGRAVLHAISSGDNPPFKSIHAMVHDFHHHRRHPSLARGPLPLGARGCGERCGDGGPMPFLQKILLRWKAGAAGASTCCTKMDFDDGHTHSSLRASPAEPDRAMAGCARPGEIFGFDRSAADHGAGHHGGWRGATGCAFNRECLDGFSHPSARAGGTPSRYRGNSARRNRRSVGLHSGIDQETAFPRPLSVAEYMPIR